MKKRKLIAGLAALVLLTGGLTGCAKQTDAPGGEIATPVVQQEQPTAQPSGDAVEKISGVEFYFDTVVTLTLYGGSQELLDEMWTACGYYENLLSKTIVTSDVARINAAGGETVTVNPETWDILRRAKEISTASGHAFSITVAPLTAMWDFTDGTQRMPTDEERIAALPLVNDDALVLGDDYTVTLPAGMMIDLGGIAKGYIADKIAEMAQGKVTGATLNFGGNVYVIGVKPNGSYFRVGIQDPNSPTGTALLALTLPSGSVVTSGIYERYFIKDGVRYHHILDPKTGLPSDSDLASATVVLDSSMTADAVATACIVLGRDGAIELLERLGMDGLLITRSGEVFSTTGFAEKYSLTMLN